MKTYVKIDVNTLEVTNTRVTQQERQHLEEEKLTAEEQMVGIQEWIDEINAKLAVLNE